MVLDFDYPLCLKYMIILWVYKIGFINAANKCSFGYKTSKIRHFSYGKVWTRNQCTAFTNAVSRAFTLGAASNTGDADSSRILCFSSGVHV